ncbi:hypothetical protein [Paenibacillus thalictri]|uniref:Flagellar assembly protein H n=1 Tax=Paenibacillus thalictri TaxID=2527873 RepID=A0A4Q9DSA2_9BACL|nr:hypothetical protein [Paenibacillus thalictri]TBL78644.1 hypothetical protein EYB31_14195 [Paenibacillus thalictri]
MIKRLRTTNRKKRMRKPRRAASSIRKNMKTPANQEGRIIDYLAYKEGHEAGLAQGFEDGYRQMYAEDH